MIEFNFSIFLAVVIPFFSLWAIGMYLIVKGWGERRRGAVFVGPVAEETKEKFVQKREIKPHIPVREAGLEELEIPVLPEEGIKPQASKVEEAPKTETSARIEPSLVEVVRKETPTIPSAEEFPRLFGKANIIEFPAEYVDHNVVKGLDGKEINIVEFVKNCYSQIGFRCVDTVIAGRRKDRLHRVSIFDLICDHYTSDEEDYINFFGENKEKFSDEIISLKSSAEFIYKNTKELVGSYANLPQLVVWNDRELFLVLVKSRYDELTQEELHWLREFIIQKKLFKTKIFKIIEKKLIEPAIAPKQPVMPPSEPPVKTTPAPTPVPVTKKITRKPFTKEEIEFLKENRDRMSNEEIAQKLNRTVDSITHKLSRAGLSRETFEWTKDKEEFLKNNFRTLSYRMLAERLGTSVPSVRARFKKLGLKK